MPYYSDSGVSSRILQRLDFDTTEIGDECEHCGYGFLAARRGQHGRGTRPERCYMNPLCHSVYEQIPSQALLDYSLKGITLRASTFHAAKKCRKSGAGQETVETVPALAPPLVRPAWSWSGPRKPKRRNHEGRYAPVKNPTWQGRSARYASMPYGIAGPGFGEVEG
jgi:hypothetical protein